MFILLFSKCNLLKYYFLSLFYGNSSTYSKILWGAEIIVWIKRILNHCFVFLFKFDLIKLQFNGILKIHCWEEFCLLAQTVLKATRKILRKICICDAVSTFRCSQVYASCTLGNVLYFKSVCNEKSIYFICILYKEIVRKNKKFFT